MAHMAKSVEISQDIIDNVIKEVGDDTRLLKQCSLVSSTFLRPSRKQLFSKITLRNDQICQGIHQLLVQNPVILSFIRTIILTHINSTSLLAILRLPFGFLECFSIDLHLNYWDPNPWDPNPWDWNNLTSEQKDAISNIIHSSNLKTLSLKGISKLPITFFLHIVHLTKLELYSLSPKDFGNEDSRSLITWAASRGVAPTDSQIVIDRCVWRLREDWDRRYKFVRIEGPTDSSIFLPFMCHLRFLEIHINLCSGESNDFDTLSFLMSSLCISLTSPATLEHLEFNIWFRGNSNEFEFSSYDDNYTFYDALRDADVWRQLDTITTHPTGSRLQRVNISINYYFDDNGEESDKHRVSKAVLDGLPLLRAKGILFVKAVLW